MLQFLRMFQMFKALLLEIYYFAYATIPYQLLVFLFALMIINIFLETFVLIKTKRWSFKTWLTIFLKRSVSILLIGLCRGLDLSIYNLMNITFIQIIVVFAYISQEIRLLAKNLLFFRQRKISAFLFYIAHNADSILNWLVDKIFFFKRNS